MSRKRVLRVRIEEMLRLSELGLTVNVVEEIEIQPDVSILLDREFARLKTIIMSELKANEWIELPKENDKSECTFSPGGGRSFGRLKLNKTDDHFVLIFACRTYYECRLTKRREFEYKWLGLSRWRSLSYLQWIEQITKEIRAK